MNQPKRKPVAAPPPLPVGSTTQVSPAGESAQTRNSSQPNLQLVSGQSISAADNQAVKKPTLHTIEFQPDMSEEAQAYLPAGNGSRLLAALIDSTISIAAASVLLALFGKGPNAGLVSNLLMVVYYVVPTWLSGATPGKYFMGLRVLAFKENGGEKAGFWRILFRETIGKFIATLVMFIGILMILFRGDRRGLHDLLCRTQVVHYK